MIDRFITYDRSATVEEETSDTHGQDKVRAEAKAKLGLRLQQQLTQALAQYLLIEDDCQVLKLTPGAVEWTTVIDRVEFRCAVYLDTRLEIIHYDDPEPEDA